jgi:dimethylhistidine N-methyltransferase
MLETMALQPAQPDSAVRAAPDRARAADPAFRADVLAGLAARPRAIPARWFYDRAGSELFEAITDLPEYYPTRTEVALTAAVAPGIAAAIPRGAALIEFGAGSAAKTPRLIEAIAPIAYVPIDISGPFLRDSAAAIAARFPHVEVFPLAADFTADLTLPYLPPVPRVGYFPGSTIGNCTPAAAVDLLRGWHRLLGAGAQLLIGVDRVKDRGRLVAAYDDAQGVTAAFNMNLLARINRELDGTVPLADFAHEARWNEARSRIEMHLVARRDTRFTVEGAAFEMAAGETIHTENSHKYTPESARLMLAAAGWTTEQEWTDPDEDFLLLLARAEPPARAP